MMELCQVITEGTSDVLLLQALLDLQSDDPNISFVAAGGWSSVDSYARTVLVQDKAHVAVVVDADSRDPNVVNDRRRFLHRSLREVALHKKFHVTVVEPEIAGLLFEVPSLVRDLIGVPLPDSQMAAAYYEPRRMLGELTQGRDLQSLLLDKLPYLNLSPLKERPDVRELRDFLVRLTSRAPAIR